MTIEVDDTYNWDRAVDAGEFLGLTIGHGQHLDEIVGGEAPQAVFDPAFNEFIGSSVLTYDVGGGEVVPPSFDALKAACSGHDCSLKFSSRFNFTNHTKL